MAGSDKWLSGAPVGPQHPDDPGITRWWLKGAPAALLGAFYTGYYVTGVVAVAVGVAASYAFQSTTPAVVTQATVETITADVPASAVVTQAVVETATPSAGDFRVTQAAIETLSIGGEDLRLTQIAVEVLSNRLLTYRYAGTTAISIGVAAAYTGAGGTELRASQAIAEAFTGGGPTRASQIVAEAFTKIGFGYAGVVPITIGVDGQCAFVPFGVAEDYPYDGITPIVVGVSATYQFAPVASYRYAGVIPVTIGVVGQARVDRANIDWHYAGVIPVTIGVVGSYYPTSHYYAGVIPVSVGVEALCYPLPFNVRATQSLLEVASQEVPITKATVSVIEVATRWYLDPCAEPDIGEDLRGAVGPLVWAEWMPGDGSTRPYAEMALPDPASYHHGFKPGRLLSVSVIRRALAGPGFDYEAGRFDVTLADNERDLRALLATKPMSYWHGRFLAIYMVSDAGRRLGVRPRLIGYGVVEDSPTLTGLTLTLAAQDFIGSQLWGRQEQPAYTAAGLYGLSATQVIAEAFISSPAAVNASQALAEAFSAGEGGTVSQVIAEVFSQT